MKKKLISLFLSLALALAPLPAAVAAGNQVVVLRLGYNQMAVGGNLQQVDEGNPAVIPLLEDGRTLVPVSRIVAAFGGASGWDGATQSATFSLNGHKVAARIDSKSITADGRPVTMDISARLIQDRTYVPLRAVLEGLGLTVNYNQKYQLILVSEQALDMDRYTAVPGVTDLLTATGAIPPLLAKGIDTPALSGGYDITSKAGTYIPDLGPATGGVFHSNEPVNQNSDHMESYHNDYPRSYDEAEGVLREYYEAISALPYFEVVEELNLKYSFYRCSFRYTGTGPVKKNSLTSLSGDVCDLELYWEKRTPTIRVYFAKGLQLVDTGLRLSISEEGDANFRVVGNYLTDGYSVQNGVYQNLSDGKLAVKSRECAMLVNGKSVKAKVDFHTEHPNETWAYDKFSISGFDRTTCMEFAFPMNYAQTGDVYTVNQFVRQDIWPFGATDKGHQWGFAVSADNGNNWVMPLDNGKNVFEGCNVRVLQWDKTGDTVVYFAAKLLLNNQDYEIEGLLAAPNRVNAENQSSGGSGEPGDCWYCGGSGVCPTCGGSGKVSNWMPGTTHTYLEQNCTDCYRDGVCRYCNGTGKH